jgi:hypothetical protein
MTRLHWETEVYNSLLKSAGKPQMTALLRARVLDCAVGLTLIVPMIGCQEVIEICGLSVPSGTKSVTLSTCVQSLPVEARNLTGLAEKYGLPVMIHGPSYGVAYFTVPASSVRQVWRVGHEKLKASNSALHDSQ